MIEGRNFLNTTSNISAAPNRVLQHPEITKYIKWLNYQRNEILRAGYSFARYNYCTLTDDTSCRDTVWDAVTDTFKTLNLNGNHETLNLNDWEQAMVVPGIIIVWDRYGLPSENCKFTPLKYTPKEP